MTNQPPREVMEAPEGFEWTGVIHCPRKSELYAEWREDRWETSLAAIDRDFMAPILRKIKSPTVMVEVDREVVARAIAAGKRDWRPREDSRISLFLSFCRALENEE